MAQVMKFITRWWTVLVPTTVGAVNVIGLEMAMIPERIRILTRGGHCYVYPYERSFRDLRIPGWVMHLSTKVTFIMAFTAVFMLLRRSPNAHKFFVSQGYTDTQGYIDMFATMLVLETLMYFLVKLLWIMSCAFNHNSEDEEDGFILLGPQASLNDIYSRGFRLPSDIRDAYIRSVEWVSSVPMVRNPYTDPLLERLYWGINPLIPNRAIVIVSILNFMICDLTW